jgi:IPT/TIG domain
MRSTWFGVSRAGTILVLVGASALVVPTQAFGGPGGHDRVPLKRHVKVSDLARSHREPNPVVAPRVGKPAVPQPPAGSRPPVVGRDDRGGGKPGTGATTLGPSTPQSAPGVLEQLTGFDGTGPNGSTPPDTQVAVGPTDVVEMVNTTGHVYTKLGTETSNFNLSTFFGAPVNAMTSPAYSDPRVEYDVLSGRFFASILIFDRCDPRPPPAGSGCTTNSDSEVDIAVSGSSSPSNWSVYVVETNTTNVLFDQPKLGASSDKVVMTYNENGFGGPYRFVVLQKSDLLAAAGSVATTFFALDNDHFNVIPVMSMSATNTEFAVNANQGSSTLTLTAFTGTPAAGNVAKTHTDFAIGTYTAPPGAVQPNDTRTLDTGVPAVQSAVWDNGLLWAAGNDSCIPPGDSQQRACLRLDRITTSGTTGSLTQDIDVGQNGAYLFYPAVMTDAARNLFIGHSVSSSTQFGTAGMSFAPVGPIPATIGGIDYRTGVGPYDCTFCFDQATPPNPTANRWGDYSGAARDPVNPWDVWFAEEWGSTSTTNTDAWGTAIGRFTQAPPTVTGVSPNSAPELSTACAPAVTVSGTDFVTGQTSVQFGATPASAVSVTSPGSLTAIAPSHIRGTVDVTVTTPAGTSDTSLNDQFTYVADTTAPTVAASVSPSPNGAGWNRTSPATAILSAADNACGSGVQKITYSATGAQPIASTDVSAASAAVPITVDGITTITFTATDNAGNTSAAQVVTVRLDTVAPSITITSPTSSTYLLNQVVNASYVCADATSGVATCTGPVPSGTPFNTATLGSNTFTVNASDVAGNPNSASVTYKVAYKICLLYDPLQPPRGGNSTIAIKVQICDANNVNQSSPAITLTLVGVARASDHVVIRPLTGTFRFDSMIAGYITNISTKGLAAGNYELQFTVAGADTTTHAAPFAIR